VAVTWVYSPDEDALASWCAHGADVTLEPPLCTEGHEIEADGSPDDEPFLWNEGQLRPLPRYGAHWVQPDGDDP